METIKKYWYLFPVLGLIVWGIVYLYLRDQVAKKMEGVRSAKADKRASDFMKDNAEEIKSDPV